MSIAGKAKQQLAVIYRGGLSRVWGPPPVLREAQAFQDDIDDVESMVDEPPPRWMRGAIPLVASLLLVMIVIASISHVETVVRAGGHLAADRPTIVLQPMERSIVRELKVKAGDVVTKGQVLATLDATFSQADLDSLTSQQSVLSARILRTEAELSGTPLPVKDGADRDYALQATLYRERLAQYASRLRAFDGAIQQAEAAIRTTQDERAAMSRQIDVAKNVEKIRGNLLDAGLGSKTQLLDAQNSSIRAEREYQAAANRLVEMKHEVETKRAERESFVNQWRGELLEGLARDRADLARIKDALAKAERLRDLVAVSAPEDGVVLDVAMHSAGSVVREAEPLVSLLPSNAALIAEVMIASDDVGYVRKGDKVVIKVDAFPYQRHGMLRGRIRSVSEQSFAAGKGAQGEVSTTGSAPGGAFHRVQVELTKATLDGLPEGVRLIPGMTVSAEVEVGQRTIISYLLYPITRGFDESIREP
jgi:hemolysin D